MPDPQFETEQDVVDALTAEIEGGGQEATAPPQEAQREQASNVPPESDVAPEEQPQDELEDSLAGLNPADLPSEVRPYYDSMLADYRRKTQEVAEQRKQYEALEQYGGAETAVQALDWLASLQNPDNALQLHRELTAALTEQGIPLSEAQEEATRQVEQAKSEEEEDIFEGARDPRVDELQKQIEDLNQYREEEQDRNLQLMLAAEYDRQEAELMRNNPEYTDEDLEAVYNLSFATGGNLIQADEVYKGLQTHLLGRYIEQKKATSHGGTAVPGSGPAETPMRYERLDDPKLDKDVMEFIQQEMAAGE